MSNKFVSWAGILGVTFFAIASILDGFHLWINLHHLNSFIVP
ncbi:MAG: hypothetical protein ACOH2V_07030 [Candidatus Saccharimonadaceae bacterium]